ncbi:Uncharacterised protein [uncultured archaeon]|nr:Uncharacterised protein [uncultured archaeon]
MKTYILILLAVLVFGIGGYLIGSKFVSQNWNYETLVIKSVNNPIDQAASLIQKENIIGLYFTNSTQEYVGFSVMNALVARILAEKAGVKTISFGILNGKCIPPFSSYNNTNSTGLTNSTHALNNTLFNSNDTVYQQALTCSNPLILVRSGPCNCITIGQQIIIEGSPSFLTSNETILSVQGFFSEVAQKIKK